MLRVTDEQIARIRAVPHFAQGHYAGLDIAATLEFYRKRYVGPLASFRQIDDETVIADLGTGYGWLAMALVAFTPARVVAVDVDAERLAAGREIAGILGLDGRIDWHTGRLGNLALADQSADIAYCIEVLEHVYRDAAALADLSRIAREVLIVTTPNKWFPVIAHDTQLPLCHMLPRPLRKVYARLAGGLTARTTICSGRRAPCRQA